MITWYTLHYSPPNKRHKNKILHRNHLTQEDFMISVSLHLRDDLIGSHAISRRNYFSIEKTHLL